MNNQYIDPNQVAYMTQPQMQRQQMSEEELQKIKVLNLADFKETARIEKLSSKKPAILFAVLGILSIISGAAYPTIQSMIKQNNDTNYAAPVHREDNVTKQEEVVEEEPTKMDLFCTKEALNNPNGMDEILNITITFEDNQIKNMVKAYTFKKTTGQTPDTEQANYLTALQPFLSEAQTIEGFDISVQEIENGTITTTNVNYDTLVYETITEKYQTNYRFNVPFTKESTKENVTTELAIEGYTCN